MTDRPPADSAETLAELLQRTRAARDASSLLEGRELAGHAWALAQRAGSDDDRADAGQLLCLFLYRLGELPVLLDVGEEVLPTVSTPERRGAKIELLRWLTLAGCELGRFETALTHANL